jgi:hypothetical protein
MVTTIYGNVWSRPYMVTYGHIWPYMVTYGHDHIYTGSAIPSNGILGQ